MCMAGLGCYTSRGVQRIKAAKSSQGAWEELINSSGKFWLWVGWAGFGNALASYHSNWPPCRTPCDEMQKTIFQVYFKAVRHENWLIYSMRAGRLLSSVRPKNSYAMGWYNGKCWCEGTPGHTENCSTNIPEHSSKCHKYEINQIQKSWKQNSFSSIISSVRKKN